jgi:hypothetical protein
LLGGAVILISVALTMAPARRPLPSIRNAE